MALAFNIFAGLTLSVSQYTKSLNYEYESVALQSYGIETSLDISSKINMKLDFKRLAGKIQSADGDLNVYGWSYSHDIGQLKVGFSFDDTQSIYIAPTAYYMPILFPIQVGALKSTAAFEKTTAMGVGIGYTKELKLEKLNVDFDASFSLLNLRSEEYKQKYSYLIDLDVNPSWKVSRDVDLGAMYNLVVGQFSVKENKTGFDYSIKSRYFLNNFFITLKYTLQ